MAQEPQPVITFTRSIGFLLLSIWLLVYGVNYFAHIDAVGVILALLAIFAGVFILIGR
jgi:hypothetical protein